MEEEKSTNNIPNLNIEKIKNIKPFLSVFIILLIILSGYYFIWRNITIKVKNVIADSLKDYKYDSINISGFPFSKKIKIKNITFGNDAMFLTKNQISVEELTISSFIFSGNLDVKFKNITTLTSSDNTVYSLAYNEEPTMNISFYSNGSLKSFNYSDSGYRVVSEDNKTLYTADKSSLNVQSVLNGETVDYSINGDFQNMQNISIVEKDIENLTKEVPETYNLKFDISSSITKKDGEIENSTIKVNNFDLIGNKGNSLLITGDIFKEPGDLYSFGNLNIILSNYTDLLNEYKKEVTEILKIQNQSLSENDKKEYEEIVNNMFAEIERVIRKNPKTTDKSGMISIVRTKNSPDYIINDESLFTIIQNIIK